MDLRRQYIELWTDPELEARLEADIENPDKYDEIWDRLEEFKRTRGTQLVCEELDEKPLVLDGYAIYSSLWIKVVGVERRPFRDTNGNLEGRNKNEEKMLDLYRYSALLCLMHTYNKKTMTQARKEAEHFFQFPEWFKSMNGI